MIFKRKVMNLIKEVINNPEIIILTGMRRVGKTTLYKYLFDEIKSDNKVFFDLENPMEQMVFEEKDYNNIIANLKEHGINPDKKIYVFIDEVQALPYVIKAIKYLYDKYKIKFFLTGSSSFYLKNLFPESLAGRKYIFELFPLDFQEFMIFNNIEIPKFNRISLIENRKNLISYEKLIKYYKEYLFYGGFPEVVLSKQKKIKKMKLSDIFKSYFEKDVKVLADFRDISIFRDLILLLMQRTGTNINITKMSSEIGVSRDTLYSFLSFLEKTYFLHLVSPFSKSVDREISGSKKLYLCDNGLINNFSRVNEGSTFENAVYLNLRKYGKIQYYKKRSGGEIDFIINQKTSIEVKLRGTIYDLKHLEKTSKQIGINNNYIVSKNFEKTKNILPALYL